MELLRIFVQKAPLARQPFLVKANGGYLEQDWHKGYNIACIDNWFAKSLIERVQMIFVVSMYIPRHVNNQERTSAWLGHIPFAYDLVARLKPDTYLELGTHNGGSYFSVCDSVQKHNLATKCFAVDTWQGDEHAGHYDESVYAFVKHYNDSNFNAFSTLLRMLFEEAVDHFEDGSIALIHIDGFHSYEAVLNDYQTWKPKMKSDGIMLFHDTTEEQPGFGVNQFWDELTREYPDQCFNFRHSHGLGVFSLDQSRPISEVLGYAPGRESDFRRVYEKRGKTLHRVVRRRYLHRVLQWAPRFVTALKVRAAG
ncbi:MAG: hypothetical protein ACJA06_002476 [Halocynthiibacter sp.]